MNKSKVVTAYYLILSLVFFGGRMYILETYHMKQGPVPMEAFHSLFAWVNAFAYFYIVPLLIIGFLQVLRFATQRGYSLFLRIVLLILYIIVAACVGFFFPFIFVLFFYGFAP